MLYNTGVMASTTEHKPIEHGAWQYTYYHDPLGFTRVDDSEGDRVFALDGHVDDRAVSVALSIYHKGLEAGEVTGRRQAQAAIRKALGVA